MVETIRNDKVLKLLIALSILGHFCFLISKIPYNDIAYKIPQNATDQLILSLLKNKTANQIVETNESNNDLKLQPKFLSEKNNSFLKQTKAQRIARFNIAGKGVENALDKELERSSTKKKKLTLASLRDKYMESVQDFSKDDILKNSSPALGMKNGLAKKKGLHSSNDYIKELELGDFTQVNTQEFKYFGFYNRIKYKLEKYWGQNIQDQAKKFMKSGRSIASDQNHLTALMIQINERGEILNVQVKSTSGLRELDEAAIKSFNQAGPFPNPPKGMLKNNIATIEWGFVVNT